MPNVSPCDPLEHIREEERGILVTGQPRISIYFAQAAPWRGHSSLTFTGEEQEHGRQQFTSDKSLLDWRRVERYGLSSTVGGIIVILLVSYRPPQAGQPPASKVLPATICLLQRVPGA